MDLRVIRELMAEEYKEKEISITDLSEKYHLSRPTVYKWLKRYEDKGKEGLKEESRAPKHSPNQTSAEIIQLVVAEKMKNRKRGPRKVQAQLKRKYPEKKIPSVSTVGYWLKKVGLVMPRRKRYHVPPYTQPFKHCEKANDVWSLDYKGQFMLLNGNYCYPLTVTDNYSRYLLCCQALVGPQYKPTRRYLESLFREHGVPMAIRSDNGTPFAGRCVGGLSRLMIWWILLGIVPERIKKGCPQENGRHERMHRSLKYEVLDTVARNLREQQRVFDDFRYEYNYDRPHESLEDKTPSEYYIKSNRPYVEHPHEPEYGYNYEVRRVRHSGEIKFRNQSYYLTELLEGYPIGLKEIGEGLWRLHFSFYELGTIDLRTKKILRN